MSSRCPQCGREIPRTGWENLCPSCLAGAALALSGPEPEASPAREPAPDFVPGREFGDYEILEEIGRGGMGIIYKARQRRLGRTVALKMILHGRFSRPEEIERFRTEAAAAGRLRHPNIVTVYESGEFSGLHYYAMEYVEGRSLAEVVDQGLLPPAKAGAYVRILADAVSHAHDRGVLHRDLKPSNILIDSAGQLRIADFGLAKCLVGESTQTRTGQTLGSPNFLAPEQVSGSPQSIGPATDLYALGAVLYYLLTGRPPFVGENLEATLLQVLQSDPVSPRRLNPSVPVDLETICMKCLQKEPLRRYPSAAELSLELERFARGEVIRARPIGPAAKTWRWCRRKPALAASLMATALAVVAGVILTFSQWRRAEAEAGRLAKALREIRLERVETLFEEGKSPTAVALLGRMFRENPDDRIVALRLTCALAHREFHLPHLPPLRHNDVVTEAAFGPGGRYLLTVSENGFVRLWDANRGISVGGKMPHSGPLSPQFSPGGNWLATFRPGQGVQVWALPSGAEARVPIACSNAPAMFEFLNETTLAVGDSAGLLRLCDFRTGEILRTLELPNARLSPDRKWALGWEDDQTLCWNARTWELVRSFEHVDRVNWARFSPDSRRLLTLCGDVELTAWDLGTGSPLTQPFTFRRPVRSAVFSPDGSQLAIQQWSGSVQLFDLESGRRTAQFPVSDRPLHDASFDRTGTWIALPYRERITVWNTRTGQQSSEPLLHERQVNSVQFGPNPAQLVSASFDGTARIWNLRTENRSLLLTHERIVTSIAFDPQGQLIATASREGTVKLWNAHTGAPIGIQIKHDSQITSIEFRRDGAAIATASTDGTARAWDCRTGAPLTPPLQHTGPVRLARFSPDGTYILTISGDTFARLWNASDGKLARSFAHRRPVQCAEFSPAGDKFITGCRDHLARIWTISDDDPEPLLLAPHSQQVVTACFSLDGKRVATGSSDGIARVWDVATGRPLGGALRHNFALVKVRFSRNARSLLTASQDSAARIWDLETGRLKVRPMWHRDKVFDAVFSPDERFVLTTSTDGTSRIWDAETGYPISEPFPQSSTLAAAQFSPDGKRLALVSPDNAARIWDVSFLAEPKPFQFLAEVAGAIAGRELGPDETLAPVPWTQIQLLKQQLAERSARDPIPRWLSKYKALISFPR